MVTITYFTLIRSFAVTGRRLWNNLPVGLRQRDICLSEFRRLLKTFLFVTFCLRAPCTSTLTYLLTYLLTYILTSASSKYYSSTNYCEISAHCRRLIRNKSTSSSRMWPWLSTRKRFYDRSTELHLPDNYWLYLDLVVRIHNKRAVFI